MSGRKLFGTDGIRGTANIYPMTCEVAMALGRAVTHYFQSRNTHIPNKHKQPLIVVGKDTRRSCYMLEQAFSAGVCSQGGRVIFTGPLPTPGVAFVTQSMRADVGVVISASHNKYHDNGIKIFDSQGNKLPDAVEYELEQMVLNPDLVPTKTGPELGNAVRLDEVLGRYIVYAKNSLGRTCDLEGKRIVLDCSNGAAYKAGPMIFSELGAEVFPLGIDPNGVNINDKCGSLHPGEAQGLVQTYRADIGICLDGDADRVIIIDEEGNVVDGDKLIGLFAKFLLDHGVLKKGDEVVGTIMTNMGLDQYLKKIGLKLHRTCVGDRYILEYMNKHGALLGGEPSGHIVFRKFSTTGDGILAALKVIECMGYYGKKVSELVNGVQLFPQEIVNIPVKNKIPLETVAPIQEAITNITEKLGDRGRISVRYSGTESLARVMVEAEDQHLVNTTVHDMAAIIQKELG